MANRRSDKVPSYRHHKASGQGFVEIQGHRHYLGRHDRPETRRKYERLIAEWLANGRMLPVEPDVITICEVLARFWTHAETYYRTADGTPSRELENLRYALRPLKNLYGDTPAASFGPRALKTVRNHVVTTARNGRRAPCRTYINKNIRRIKGVFRWAVAEELVAPSVYHALLAVAGLKKGRSEARETEPVRPVRSAHIDAVIPHVSRQVAAMIQIQLHTGARAGEVAAVRPCDIDRSGEVWTYKPVTHKTAHHGHDRQILFGPKTQRVLKPFLLRPPETPLFSPKEAEAERLAALHAARKTPLSCGNRPGSNRRRKPKRAPGSTYSVAAYRHAIQRACDEADVPRWSPHRLRHTSATNLRKEFGIDVAQTILGHRLGSAITEVYAEANWDRARRAISRVG